MAEQSRDQLTLIKEIETLLVYYSFDHYHDFIEKWLDTYSHQWIRLAILEALYLGRYKSISVDQILATWSRKGNYSLKFNHDFESLICGNLPKNLTELSVNTPTEIKTTKPTYIHEFKPNFSPTHFFIKLKAVSQSPLEI